MLKQFTSWLSKSPLKTWHVWGVWLCIGACPTFTLGVSANIDLFKVAAHVEKDSYLSIRIAFFELTIA